MPTNNGSERTNSPETLGPPPVENSSKGCCLYGCLGVVLFCIGTVVCGGVGTFWFLSSQVEKYTANKPSKLPTVVYAPEEITKLETEIESFTESIENEAPTPKSLVLSADDINALISRNKDLRGKVHVEIADGNISGDVSVPTDAIPGGKGRFFNAKASFDVSFENGVLIVTLAAATVQDKPVPNHIIEAMSEENLAKDLYNDPKAAKWISRFESLRIEEDKIILTPHAPKTSDDPEQPSEETNAESSEELTAEAEAIDL
ncbi:hypothetical protein [Planctomycetes bacterium CA13]